MGLAPSSLSATESRNPIEWRTIDTDAGVVHTAIARPSGAGPFPAVIILHGTHGFAEEYVELARDFARRGVMAIAVCWFTGAHGAGARFVTPIPCDGGPAFIDAAGAARFVVARRTLDAVVSSTRMMQDVCGERVALFGHSRGAGAALDHAFLRPNHLAALVLNSGGYPATVTSRARSLKVPVLILHGTADDPADGGSAVTNVEMARGFERALLANHNPVESKYYEGSRHNGIFGDAAQYRDVLERAVEFVQRSAACRPSSTGTGSSPAED